MRAIDVSVVQKLLASRALPDGDVVAAVAYVSARCLSSSYTTLLPEILQPMRSLIKEVSQNEVYHVGPDSLLGAERFHASSECGAIDIAASMLVQGVVRPLWSLMKKWSAKR